MVQTGRVGQRLVQVPNDVFNVFQTHRNADQVLANTASGQLLSGQLLVRGRTRVQHQGTRVTNVRQVACQLQRTDELATDQAAGRLLGALDTEGEHGTDTQRQQLLRALVVRVVFQASVVHVGDTLILNQPVHNLLSIRQVRVHALRQGLNTLQQVERGLRAQRRAEVTQLLRTQLGQEAVLTEVTPPGHTVVGGNRLGHGREVAVTPVEATGLDDDTAEGGAVTAQELGDRVNDDVRTVFEGTD